MTPDKRWGGQMATREYVAESVKRLEDRIQAVHEELHTIASRAEPAIGEARATHQDIYDRLAELRADTMPRDEYEERHRDIVERITLVDGRLNLLTGRFTVVAVLATFVAVLASAFITHATGTTSTVGHEPRTVTVQQPWPPQSNYRGPR